MKDFLDWAKPGSPTAALAARVDPNRLPRHIAIIMDGNGRWARRRLLPRVAGHRAGVESVRSVIEASARLGLDALTLYAFSVENWKRPRGEVDTLWNLLLRYLVEELPRLHRYNIRFQAIGRLHELPQAVREGLDHATEKTAGNTGLRLNLALNYGGRTEIVDAVNRLLEQARALGPGFQVDEEILSDHLYTSGLPDPDLLIRTSGEVRISNFLLWQIAYTEIWVTPKLWPEFRADDLLEGILDYQGRERRFGGLSPQEEPAEPALVGAAVGERSDLGE
ncbi:MAG: isoprenyl transferase [Acidobacteria bacterium]|nr:isoprenyl transferase [Acidobacteriota bacterium]